MLSLILFFVVVVVQVAARDVTDVVAFVRIGDVYVVVVLDDAFVDVADFVFIVVVVVRPL